MRHGMYATFMAKPMQNEPGSAMHIHQSVIDAKSGQNIFSRHFREGPADTFKVSIIAFSLANCAGYKKV